MASGPQGGCSRGALRWGAVGNGLTSHLADAASRRSLIPALGLNPTVSYPQPMNDRIRLALFSLSGLSLALGALGFLSGVVQLFIDTSAAVSVKWLLFVLWMSVSALLVALKIIHDLSYEKQPPAVFEIPIKYLSESKILVIRRNENFSNSIIVGCYVRQDDIDTLAGVGVVHIVQDRVIQIKLHSMTNGLDLESPDALTRLVIRPVVPIDALNQFTAAGTSDE